MKTLEIKKQLVTPNIAKFYLEQNDSNRLISQPTLFRYANDMKNGKWKEDTGETIKISKTGRILDGQHRLQAIIKSNCAIYLHVITNIDDSVFDVLDTGKKRNSSDCFHIAGIANSNAIPSIIAFFNLLKNNQRTGQQINHISTNAELLKQYYDDEMYWQNITKQSLVWYKSFSKIITQSHIGGFYAYFYSKNPAMAKNFMHQLCTGFDMSNTAIGLLRNKLIQDKTSLSKITVAIKIALIIKTWNYYILGDSVKILKYDQFNEKYPVAIGVKL